MMLSKRELKWGLSQFGVELNLRELDDVFANQDEDESGQLELEEFMHGLRGGELNDARYDVVQEAWDHNLRTIKGADTKCIPRAIPLAGLVEKFDCSWYPAIRSGKVKEEDVVAAFEAAM